MLKKKTWIVYDQFVYRKSGRRFGPPTRGPPIKAYTLSGAKKQLQDRKRAANKYTYKAFKIKKSWLVRA